MFRGKCYVDVPVPNLVPRKGPGNEFALYLVDILTEVALRGQKRGHWRSKAKQISQGRQK